MISIKMGSASHPTRKKGDDIVHAMTTSLDSV